MSFSYFDKNIEVNDSQPASTGVENGEDIKEKKYTNWGDLMKLEPKIDLLEEESIRCSSFNELEVSPLGRVQMSENNTWDSKTHKGKLFKSTVCEYENKSHLIIHKKCTACDYQPSSILDLENHLTVKHTTLCCDLCSFRIRGDCFNALLAHMVMHHISEVREKYYKCTLCDFQSKSRQQLQKHSNSRHQVKLKKSLEKHKLLHKGPLQSGWFNCNTCKYQTEFKEKLRNHVKIHKEKKHTCDVCGLKFVFKARLEIHLKTHLSPEQVPILKCDLCPFESRYKKSLTDHVLLHKNPEELNYVKCNYCNFKCLKKYNLRMHLLTHKDDGEVPTLKCDSCDYYTKFKPRLRRHVKVHHLGLKGTNAAIKKRKIEGQMPRKYNRINRRARSNDVDKDLKKPIPAEGYMCDVCGLKTKYKGSLKTHSLVHKTPQELKMFTCSYNCGFETKLKGTLKVHELTHKDPSEITMFSCHLCNFKNRKKYNLKMHLLTHKNADEVDMIKCKGCDYQTKFKSYMKAHLKKKHLISKGE